MILPHYGAFLTMYIDVIHMLIICSFLKSYNLKKKIERIHITCQEWNTVSVSSLGGEAPERGRQAFSLLCQYETGVHKLSLLGLAI